MKLEQKRLEDLLQTLCYNKLQDNDMYIIPYYALHNQPCIFTELEFTNKLMIPQWWFNTDHVPYPNYFLSDSSLKEFLARVFFDGKGFYIPCFSTYVNKKPENQIPNDVKYIDRKIEKYYNFDMDIAFAAFCTDLHNNFDDFKTWVSERQEKIKSAHLFEFMSEKNTDFAGLDEKAAPYLKKIDEFINKQT